MSGTTQRGRKRQRHLLRRRPYGACARGRGSYERFGSRRPFQVTRTPAGSAFLSRSLHGDRRGRDKLIRSLFEKKKKIDKRKRFVFLSALADVGVREQLSVRKGNGSELKWNNEGLKNREKGRWNIYEGNHRIHGSAHQTAHLHHWRNHNQRGFVQMNIDFTDNCQIRPAMYFLVSEFAGIRRAGERGKKRQTRKRLMSRATASIFRRTPRRGQTRLSPFVEQAVCVVFSLPFFFFFNKLYFWECGSKKKKRCLSRPYNGRGQEKWARWGKYTEKNTTLVELIKW